MYGNTSTTSNTRNEKTRQEYDDAIFGSTRSEHGFHHFQDPEYQRAFHLREEKYTLTFLLKKAFEGQEFLRKMRADMKREYLTRKRQIKKLQTDQAVVFRDAEMKLQEFYSATTGVPVEAAWKSRDIDITSPLVTTFQLPFGNTLDLKELDTNEQFANLCEFHIKLRSDKERELLHAELVQQEDEERERYFEEQAQADAQQWRESRPWIAALSPQERWSYFLTHNEQEMIDEAQIAKVEYKRAREEENHFWMNSCRQTMERAAWVYKMKIFEMMTPEEREVDLKECERQVREYGRDTRYPTMYPEETEETEEEMEEETEEEKAEREEKETLHQMLHDEKDFKEMLEDDGLVVPQLNDVEAQDPKAFVTCGSAKSKPSSSAAAAASAKKTTKARIAKQQKKPKYVPFDIHSVENAKVSKEDVVVINMPKKILQGESREDVKRYNRKWNKKNAMAKQSSARGTGIPNLYVPNKWDCNSYSDEE